MVIQFNRYSSQYPYFNNSWQLRIIYAKKFEYYLIFLCIIYLVIIGLYYKNENKGHK